jgi:hypothetical protein
VQSTWDHAYGGASTLTGDHELIAEATMLRSWIEDGTAEYLR